MGFPQPPWSLQLIDDAFHLLAGNAAFLQQSRQLPPR